MVSSRIVLAFRVKTIENEAICSLVMITLCFVPHLTVSPVILEEDVEWRLMLPYHGCLQQQGFRSRGRHNVVNPVHGGDKIVK